MQKKVNNAKQTYLIYYPQIIELIRLLASPFEIQKSAFPDTEDPLLEIADELEIKEFYFEHLTKEGLISFEEFRVFSDICKKIESFPKYEWTIEAMKAADSWNQMRKMALDVLHIFRVDYAKPNIYWYPL